MLQVTHIIKTICLMKEALAEVGDFEIKGGIIIKVKFTDYTCIIAKSREELRWHNGIMIW